MGQSCSVVIVPDFTGPAARRFEALAMLCLSAWREHAGRAASAPFHLACIGAPPESVRRLAAREGATFSVHPPLVSPAAGFANKLRALEWACDTDYLVYLDADMVTLGDMGGLLDASADIMLAPASVPRVPTRLWERIYREVGVTPPPEALPCTMQEGSWGWGASSRVRDAEGRPFSTYPYFNSGVLLVKREWARPLRRYWEEDMARIARVVDAWDPFARETVEVDQTGLSTAIQRLREEGASFRRLPERYNVRWHHLFLRTLPRQEVRLYHAFGLAKHPVAARSMAGMLYGYPFWTWYRLALLAVRERRKLHRVPSLRKQVWPSYMDAWHVSGRIRRIYDRGLRLKVTTPRTRGR